MARPRGRRRRLGHQRLAIVDPTATADQPFTYASDSADWRAHAADAAAPKAVLVANGEIYNHGSILASLGDEGYDLGRVKSSSDCEAIIHNYLARGPRRAVEDLSGMYAIVLIDEAGGPGTGRPSLLAARDRVGIKPLYWARDAHGSPLAFASELKTLVGAPASTPRASASSPRALLHARGRPRRLHCPRGASRAARSRRGGRRADEAGPARRSRRPSSSA